MFNPDFDYPFETEKDFKQTLKFLSKSKLNFATLNPLMLYPGTSLFENYKEHIDFNIYPYKNEWKNKSQKTLELQNKKFYLTFYFRFNFFTTNRKIIFKYFFDNLRYGLILLRYLLIKGKFPLTGIRTKNQK